MTEDAAPAFGLSDDQHLLDRNVYLRISAIRRGNQSVILIIARAYLRLVIARSRTRQSRGHRTGITGNEGTYRSTAKIVPVPA